MSAISRIALLLAFTTATFLLPSCERASPTAHSEQVFTTHDYTGGFPLVLESMPVRVLPVSAGAADFVTALIDDDRIVALPETVLEFSAAYATGAKKWAGQTFPTYSAESVLQLEPDLVVADSIQSPATTGILRSAGIPVIVLPPCGEPQDLFATIQFLGQALHAEERAQALEEDLRSRVNALATTDRSKRLAVAYSNYGAGGWVAGKGTNAHLIFRLCGLSNAAAKAGFKDHSRVELEGLIVLQPNLIVVGENRNGRSPTADLLTRHPDLAQLDAVRSGNIVTIPAHLFGSNSWTLIEAAEVLADKVDALAQ